MLVPVEGIEPPLLAEHDFESCASTSSATRAWSANRKTRSNCRSVALVEHDLFGKPATTFPDRAQVEPAFGNRLRLALQPRIYIAGYRARQKKIKLSWPRPTKQVS